MRGFGEPGVALDPRPGVAPREPQQFLVAAEVGHGEGRQAALARAEQFAGPADRQVKLGDLESVVGGGDRLEASATR